MPKLVINDNTVSFPIWDSDSANTQLGNIYPGEIFVIDMDRGSKPDYAYTAKLGWTRCWIPLGEFGARRAYGSQFAQWSLNSSRYVFYIRRRCRIFRGTTLVTYLYPGDQICTDGNSDAGSTYPDRLSINGYNKGGKWTYGTGLWCDTDINLGYSMKNEVTTYGKW